MEGKQSRVEGRGARYANAPQTAAAVLRLSNHAGLCEADICKYNLRQQQLSTGLHRYRHEYRWNSATQNKQVQLASV